MLRQGLKVPTTKQFFVGLAVVVVGSLSIGGLITFGVAKLFHWI